MKIFWKDTLLYGLIGGLMFSFGIISVLSVNPLLFYSDYPADIIAAVDAMDLAAPTVVQTVMGSVVLFGPLLFALVMFNRRLIAKSKQQNTTFWQQFAYLYPYNFVFMMIVMLVDLLVVDWLLMNTLQVYPLVIEGTAGLAGYNDYGFHLMKHFGTLDSWIAAFVLPVILTAIFIGFNAIMNRRKKQ